MTTLEQAKIIFAKTQYINTILQLVKENPDVWNTFSHEKQIECHRIKAELDAFFEKRGSLK